VTPVAADNAANHACAGAASGSRIAADPCSLASNSQPWFGTVIGLRSAVRVANLFWPEFEERDGAVLRAGTQIGTPQGEFSNTSEFERFYTHTHVLDEFRNSIPTVVDTGVGVERPDPEHRDFAIVWALAKRIGHMWRCKLACDFPTKRFRVYVTRFDDPIVRFHELRASESSWLSDAELETMARDDTVLMLET
jgi:hypothetical protein